MHLAQICLVSTSYFVTNSGFVSALTVVCGRW